jgi:hypothetical protein
VYILYIKRRTKEWLITQRFRINFKYTSGWHWFADIILSSNKKGIERFKVYRNLYESCWKFDVRSSNIFSGCSLNFARPYRFNKNNRYSIELIWYIISYFFSWFSFMLGSACFVHSLSSNLKRQSNFPIKFLHCLLY